MEITLKKSRFNNKWFGAGVFITLLLFAGVAASTKTTKSIDINTLSFRQVKAGPLDIYTQAFGEFASAKERLLTAPAYGKVSEILVRPGAIVSPDTVILTLANPELEQQVSEAQGQLAQQKAQREAFKYEQQNERLNYQGRIADIKANIEKYDLELSVNQSLLTLGVASKIELQRATLNLKQEKKRLEFEQEKYAQFVEMQGFQLTQRDIIIEQQQKQVSMLEQRLANMHVTAGIQGTLQSLNVALGESINQGHSIAKVGSDKELIARLRLPQHLADQIDIHAPVIIDSQKGKVTAKIIRIESVVSNGAVMAEAEITGPLTSNARPSLAISAQVFVRHEQNASYIAQAPGLRPRSKQQLFVKNEQNILRQQEVMFGELTQQKLLITSGLKTNDQIVSSDMSEYKHYSTLELTQ
ncbi:efflux RND transporter periplasmic adaptor subunit [Thalassotalea marina]|uniref:RND transporter n=1 Tax=Thalassotalea marina TaxID=1673741 RepID=A0A919BNK4_9GAMM|nr:HlyD family efflux transporter periplasmic adaptor subunit [Thalassotalea marina]GHG00443.1 RND transporter [Thalassotalea marina]